MFQTWSVTEVRGVVLDQGRPVAGATVRVKASHFQTTTDPDGSFQLKGFPAAFRLRITAWADGYYIGGAEAWPWERKTTISLEHYRGSDNPTYQWVPPKVEGRSAVEDFITQMGLVAAEKVSFDRAFLPLSSRLSLGCADCHGRTIYDQWASSAHAQGTANIRFMTMYNGTSVSGAKSPPTRYGFNQDYGRFPLKPSPDASYYGPGFKLDFPDQPGNCAACHAPAAALAEPGGADMNTVTGANAQGSPCDFCHKIADVRLDPAKQAPSENMPGVLSMELRRPAGEPQIFFGPYDDVDVGPDAFSPLQNDSRFCAPCHNASFWGTPIYQSYTEWLASPYPKEGKTCQTCHMKPDGKADNFAPGRGGVTRDPKAIFTHTFPGVSDLDLLRNAAKLELIADRQDDRVLLEVRVTNENAGHHIPTDNPMRNIILVVEAKDDAGKDLPILAGPSIPAWGGRGKEPTDYAGRPGKGYAKVLEELWTEASPTAAYWRQTVIREDTRIPAKGADVASFEFAAPEHSSVTVDVRLIFRRAFKELAMLKEWSLDDLEMAHQVVELP
ncbi:MAG: carboxypeptidase regulatory-like domain-containing protein [Chloroflexi bacterium]|nr:carboxypeptidase regulatory-like domain-containing protein [Chloroflexota bacterium]